MSKTQKSVHHKETKYDSSYLKPGRHLCSCQARVHYLVRNCLNCGRIVCAQEGSGPCFHCGNMVCTREERKILEENSKRSLELMKRLMKDDLSNSTKSNNFSLSLSGLGTSISQANEYKEKLLEADKSRDRTKVHDLESDYYNLENNVYLSPEDREAIIRRKEELRQLNLQNSRKTVFDLDISNKSITEKRQQTSVETINDPVIQSILLNSQQNYLVSSDRLPEKADFVKDFVPMYRSDLSEQKKIDEKTLENLKNLMSSKKKSEVYCISLHPSIASLYARGERRHLPCKIGIKHKGPIFLGTLNKSMKSKIFLEEFLPHGTSSTEENDENTAEHPSAIIGQGIVVDCLTWAEYKLQFPEGECSEVKGCFVLILDGLEMLPFPVPYSPHSNKEDPELHIVSRHYKNVIAKILSDGLNFDSLDLNTL